MTDYIEIGKIVNTHGLRGELKILPWCDDISMFADTTNIYIDNAPYKISSAKPHKNVYLVRLEGVDTIEAAELLKTKVCTVKSEDMPALPDGEYYVKDLKGLSVYEDDTLLGILTDCFPTGSNDVYVISRDNQKDLLIPAIKQVVLGIDTEKKRIDVKLMEGLE